MSDLASDNELLGYASKVHSRLEICEGSRIRHKRLKLSQLQECIHLALDAAAQAYHGCRKICARKGPAILRLTVSSYSTGRHRALKELDERKSQVGALRRRLPACSNC